MTTNARAMEMIMVGEEIEWRWQESMRRLMAMRKNARGCRCIVYLLHYHRCQRGKVQLVTASHQIFPCTCNRAQAGSNESGPHESEPAMEQQRRKITATKSISFILKRCVHTQVWHAPTSKLCSIQIFRPGIPEPYRLYRVAYPTARTDPLRWWSETHVLR